MLSYTLQIVMKVTMILVCLFSLIYLIQDIGIQLIKTMIDILLQKDPKRDLATHKGPKDCFNRRFSATLQLDFKKWREV
jgi:hypothetical protein